MDGKTRGFKWVEQWRNGTALQISGTSHAGCLKVLKMTNQNLNYSTLTTSSLTARPMPPVSLERVVSPNPAVESVKSNDSDKTLSGSSDSIGTAYRMDSQVLSSTLFWHSYTINYLD